MASELEHSDLFDHSSKMQITIISFHPRDLHLHSYDSNGTENTFMSVAGFVNKRDQPTVVHQNILNDQ